MRRFLSFGLAAAMALGLTACGGGGGGSADDDRSVFRRLYGSEVETLNYLYTSNTNDYEMCANMVDCLVEYDQYGVMQPALAESWEHNDDYTEWTFHIRPGVKWVDAEGNEVADVTANDWVSSARWVNDAANNSSNQYMYNGIVKNAEAYFNYTAYLLESENGTRTTDDEGDPIEPVAEVSFDDVGVKAVDDNTLVYTMETPCTYFPTVLSYTTYMPVYGPFLEEMGDSFGVDNYSVLYNGAYIMTSFEPQNQRILTKNETYWDKDNVFIDEIQYLYNTSATQLGPESFIRGEVDWAQIDASILSAWLEDPERQDMVSPSRANVSFSYFFCFNFEPRFDDSLEPDNWLLAVNNENFRQSIRYGLDRINALTVVEPEDPESLLNRTITPATFTSAAGLDYTQYPALQEISSSDGFNEELALQYKEAAVEELTAAGATFPIQMYMRYNPDTANWDRECQVIEQQLEGLLGTDYIDIVVEAGPSTNFLSTVRRAGDYGFMKCNWGADYADPQTWTDPFKELDNSYNFMGTDAGTVIGQEPCTNKSAETQALTDQYYDLVEAAKAITTDTEARYAAFAEAEAFLIDHAFVIPFSISNDGYIATRLNIFEAQYAPYGMALQSYKFQKLRDEPMSMDEYNELYAQWEIDREAALAAAETE
ncbi:peptide ABC transporter substrate-binding protein [uncultured Intestinimonas sp.]|uniref:peptide ABC transporter substrate-binding protein n=1 Tax=uncultured Intestinimonas sp. TaxID=1689265 RepID=UPI0025DD1F68|nr:peptide ABC transporter substrate-binding protein [uncultured Intestinimonas sp.]